MEQRIEALENLLADLERESQEIRSVLDKRETLQTDLLQKMVGEMKALLGRLRAIETQLETLEGS
jgi:hypothetical protein